MNKKWISFTLALSMIVFAVPTYALDQTTTGSDKALTVSAQTDAQMLQNIETYLKGLEANRNFSGQVLLSKDGKILLNNAYGYADYEKKIKATPQTTFEIGSATKQFTAMCVAKLVEQKKIAFSDPISKYVKGVPNGDKITIHHLLTHTSGLHNFTETEAFIKLKPDEATYDKLMALIAKQPTDFEPGTKMSYSNTGYLVLTKLVETVNGKPLIDVMQESIFKPLGMDKTGLAYQGSKKMVESVGYNGYLSVTPDPYDELLIRAAHGAGFLSSTTEDLFKWDQALKSNQLVSKETMDQIWTGYTTFESVGKVGYGWFISDGLMGKEIFHGGNTNGFTALNLLMPEKQMEIIILENKKGANTKGLYTDLQRLVKGETIATAQPYKTVNLPKADLPKYAGTFNSENGSVIVAAEKGQLILTSLSGMPLQLTLTADSATRLYSKDLDLIIDYKLDAKGNSTSMVCTFVGEPETLKKQVATKKYIQLNKSQLSKLIGTYEIKGVFNIKFFEQKGKIMAQADGQPAFELKAVSASMLESEAIGAVFTFDTKAKPIEFVLKQNNISLKGVKSK